MHRLTIMYRYSGTVLTVRAIYRPLDRTVGEAPGRDSNPGRNVNIHTALSYTRFHSPEDALQLGPGPTTALQRAGPTVLG